MLVLLEPAGLVMAEGELVVPEGLELEQLFNPITKPVMAKARRMYRRTEGR
jgi:hypothetical protein